MKSQTLPMDFRGVGFYLIVASLSFSVFFAVDKAYKILPIVYFIAAFFYVIKEKPFIDYKAILFYFCAVFFVVLGDLLNIYFGNSDFSGIEQVTRNVVLILPLIFILECERLTTKIIVGSVFFMLCVTAFASVFQYFGMYAQDSSHLSGGRVGLWWNSVPFANSIVLFLGLILGSVLVSPKSYWMNIIVVLACTLMLVVVYLSGTRSALLSYFFVIFIYLFMTVKSDKRIWFRSLIGVFLLVLVAAASYLFGDRVELAVEQLYSHFHKGAEFTSVSIRLSSWYYSWLIFLDNPLFGHGTEGAILVGKDIVEAGLVPEYVVDYHSHSDVFDALKRNGLLGFLGLLWVYISPFLLMWYFKLSARDVAPVFLVVIALFVSGLTEVNIRHNVSSNSFYMAYMLAIAVVFKSKVQRGQSL